EVWKPTICSCCPLGWVATTAHSRSTLRGSRSNTIFLVEIATVTHPHSYQQAPVGIFVSIDFHRFGATLISRSLMETWASPREDWTRCRSRYRRCIKPGLIWFPAKVAALGT